MMVEKLTETSEIIAANPASPVSLFLVQNNYMREGYEKLNDIFSKLDTSLAYIPTYKKTADYLHTIESTQIFKTAPDFTIPSIEDGKEITLSSLRGKYLLVDFWASWCRPCRAENPNVKAAYKKYKSKGFEVLSVSVDRDTAAWKSAVNTDGMTWIQGHDTNNISYSLYGVMSIPTTLLLDKDGVIIEKNLRGAALEEKLKELFK
jgi:thiol-disulfide isomerase/thioredoxin